MTTMRCKGDNACEHSWQWKKLYPHPLLSLWTSILKALAYHLLQNDYVGQLYGILGALHACLFPLYTLTQGISPYPYI